MLKRALFNIKSSSITRFTRRNISTANMKDVDSAILKALELSEKETTIKSHGGSDFSQTLKLTATKDGEEKEYFVKIGGKDSKAMFEGEHTSLSAIHDTDPTFCPKSYAHGELSAGEGCFLVTAFLRLTLSASAGTSFAHKLVAMHLAPTPTPGGYDTPQFGFPVDTACGNTMQDNTYASSWADFYGGRRLRGVLAACEKNNGADADLKELVDRVIEEVVSRLLEDGHLTRPDGSNIKPALVHGDLWSGNHGRAKGKDGEVRDVVYDPSSSWSHAEFEWGIMKMFGGFSGIEDEYYREMGGKDKPVEEWGDRVRLYELYHHLNHHALFGAGYRTGAVSIMKSLLAKYEQNAST